MMEWELCTCWFSKRLIDGTYSNGRLMRRKINGEWQYRHLTESELSDWFSREAW